MAEIIVFTVLVLVLFVASLLLNKKDRVPTVGWCIVCLLVLMAFGISYAIDGTYKEGQSDALDGNFKYERRFVIPEGDSVVVDTLYIKL